MNKILLVVRRDGLLFTLRRTLAWTLGHTSLGSRFSFHFYRNYKLHFTPSMLTYVLFANPESRKEDTAVIEKFSPLHGVVIDVGAHIGSTAIVAASAVGPQGKVLAIEASPRFYEILKRNVALNNLNEVVTCLPYALGDKPGTVHLNESVSDDTTNHIASNGTPVEQTTLDALTQHLDHIDFLKIDVEGYEPKVLSGATETLKKTKCVYIEFNTDNLERAKTNPLALISTLRESFVLYTRNEGLQKEFTFKTNLHYNTDLICLKK